MVASDQPRSASRSVATAQSTCVWIGDLKAGHSSFSRCDDPIYRLFRGLGRFLFFFPSRSDKAGWKLTSSFHCQSTCPVCHSSISSNSLPAHSLAHVPGYARSRTASAARVPADLARSCFASSFSTEGVLQQRLLSERLPVLGIGFPERVLDGGSQHHG
jgi:hypothetical protein